MFRTLFVSLLALPSGLMAQESAGFTLCKNRDIVRSIRVEKDSSTNQYVTYYTKSGQDREVGRARWRPSAEKFQTNIQSNLEKAGWQCSNIQKL